ncbi:Serine/threonine-protein kinase Nek1 [Durusdinium trenchii]|uniref:Serine/threonine-protein kinase Nek1 n=1 Tax=Durusdinium trenchii TaxID=1381693 RepID=A0ABP0SLA7_9DINO
MQMELRSLEKSVAGDIRALNPLLFQRFDDVQLDRFQVPVSQTALLSMIDMAGKINLFLDPNGVGERQEIGRGAIFGEKHFRLGDESMLDAVGGAAQCEEPCVIGAARRDWPLGYRENGVQAAYADRAFGNRKIALSMRHVLPEGFVNGKVDFASLSFAEKTKLLEADREKQSGAVKHALEELAKAMLDSCTPCIDPSPFRASMKCNSCGVRLEGLHSTPLALGPGESKIALHIVQISTY